MKKSTTPILGHIPDFLDWLDIERGLASQTQENYSRFLSRFSMWLHQNDLAKLKPHELTSDHILKYRIYLARQTVTRRSGEPLDRSTQERYLVALRSLLTFFAEREIAALAPDRVKLPKKKADNQVRFLSVEQLERLFKAPDVTTPSGLRDRAILEVFFSTGMRISELVALDRKQIESSLNTDELELGIVGKGGRARTVYFSQRALDWLTKYLKERQDDDDALFVNYRARKDAVRRLTPRAIEKRIHTYAIKAGLPPNTTPHVLRHTFATDLLRKGVDIRVLQEFLGHKSITATQIYTHVTSKHLRDIHRKFHSGYTLDKD